MKKMSILIMVVLLTTVLATSALAKKNSNAAQGHSKAKSNVTNNADVEAKRNHATDKAAKIHDKREETRQRVDQLMKVRRDMIKQDDPGYVGPVGD